MLASTISAWCMISMVNYTHTHKRMFVVQLKICSILLFDCFELLAKCQQQMLAATCATEVCTNYFNTKWQHTYKHTFIVHISKHTTLCELKQNYLNMYSHVCSGGCVEMALAATFELTFHTHTDAHTYILAALHLSTCLNRNIRALPCKSFC